MRVVATHSRIAAPLWRCSARRQAVLREADHVQRAAFHVVNSPRRLCVGAQATGGVMEKSEVGAASTEADTGRIDSFMGTLSAHKKEWAELPISEKVAILKEIKGRLLHQPISWARASALEVKRLVGEDSVGLEMLVTVLTSSSLIDGYIASLSAFERTGAFPAPPARSLPSGQTVVQAFPWGFKEKKLNPLGAAGVEVDLYLQPGAPVTQGHFYKDGKHGGKLCVALGAGNQQFLTVSDVLHQLFVEGCVVALKYHPLMGPVAPYIDYLFEPLSRRGLFASLSCDLPATQHLVYHPQADCVCMTGGTATHDAIVWGSDPKEQAERKSKNDPKLKVPIMSELGNVTPFMLVPGTWTEEELNHHAQALATAVNDNVSCNCIAAKVVLMAEGWEQGDVLLSKFKSELEKYKLPNPYYPGVRQRYEAFKQRYPQAQAVPAPPADPSLPCGEPLPTLVNVLDSYPAKPKEEYAFQVEPFAPAVTFVKVPCTPKQGQSLQEAFLEEAVRAANEDLWGTLACTLVVDPRTQEQYSQAVQGALDKLRFGMVCLNAWAVSGYTVMAGHWGAFQGDQTIKDIGSGLGGVHNVYLYDKPQKTVLKTPFVSSIHPLPPYVNPLPMGVAKVVSGLSHSGLLGVLRMLLFAK